MGKEPVKRDSAPLAEPEPETCRDDPKCPVCGDSGFTDKGLIARRENPSIAGVKIAEPFVSPHLYGCKSCQYFYTYPPIPENIIRACYSSASVGHWDTDDSASERRSYGTLKELIDRFASGRQLLDIGCFDGGFAAYLNKAYETFGIEPAVSAASRAESRGIKVLGRTIDDLKKIDREFDVITLLDVAEHLLDPVQSFKTTRDHLAPHGIILMQTGDMDTFPWPDLINLNPYCAPYDHVGFFNRSSTNELASQTGLRLSHYQNIEHTKLSQNEKVKRYLKMQLYWLIRTANRSSLPLPVKFRKVANGPIPVPPVAKDHMAAVLQKA